MTSIPAEKVRKDNTNLRKHSDILWRELRKLRFKKAAPDMFTNEMAAEQLSLHSDPHSDFVVDIEKFITTKLSKKEADIFRLYVFGGRIRQVDIGDTLGVSQSTVTNTIVKVLGMFKEYYWPELKTTKELLLEED